MPWEIKKKGSQYCVHKKGSSSPVPGGCHSSRADAIKHQRALYAKEPTAAHSILENGMKLWIPTATMTSEILTTNAIANATFTFASTTAEREEDDGRERWEGILGLEGSPTSDRRYLIPGEIRERELPLPFHVQIVTNEGHDGSECAGRIEGVEHIPLSEFARRDEFPALEDVREEAVVIWATGSLDGSPASEEAKRLIENGAGVSLDLPHDRVALFNGDTFEEIKEEISLEEFIDGNYLQGLGGAIGGATIVSVAAFEETRVRMVDGHALVASAYGFKLMKPTFEQALNKIEGEMGSLVASGKLAAPIKPPREWFDDPKFRELTPLKISKDGRVSGHLADWDGCHIGFEGICVPPFRSSTNYAYFNTGEIETANGDLIPCGKIMFCRDGNGHAGLELSLEEAASYYDDATKVGAFVRAGSDRFGTWLAGTLRADLDDLEIQHLRTHPPSGDWRPLIGQRITELIAAFAVPIGGFPLRRAMVASANGEISAIITAPLIIESDALGKKRRQRKWKMARDRYMALSAQMHSEDPDADPVPPVAG